MIMIIISVNLVSLRQNLRKTRAIIVDDVSFQRDPRTFQFNIRGSRVRT